MWRKIVKGIAIFLAVMIVLLTGMFIALAIFNSPTYAWSVISYGQSDIGDVAIFPERAIQNGTGFSVIQRGKARTPHEVEYPYEAADRKEVLEDLLQRTGTRAFLILKDDQLVYGMYLKSSRKEINTSFSSAKSFNSALIGAAIADGSIGSVDDTVIKYIPEIAGRGLDQLTIRDLLLMNSGIRYVEGDELPIYYAPFADDALTYYPPDLRKIALRAARFNAQGDLA